MARKRVLDLTAAATLSRNHSGSIVTLSAVNGFTVTLPPAGRGLNYEFYVKTAITGAASYYTITVPSVANASIKGAVTSGASAGAAKSQASTGHEKVRLGTINGGAIGTRITMTCDNDKKWNVTGSAIGSGDTTIFA
jgi:hypothetical protein